MIESLRRAAEHGRQWFVPVIEEYTGLLALLRGEFDAASAHLETAIAGLAAADMQNTSIAGADWFVVSEPLVYTHSHLAVARFMHGDLVGAESEFACAAHHAERLDFPQGPYTVGYARMLEIGMRIEAGQLDRAAVLAADLSRLGETHGFDVWRVVGATWQAAIGDSIDQSALDGQIATMNTLLGIFDASGGNLFRTAYEAALGRLLMAAGRPDAARECLDSALALAQDTGMHFYDAELMRLRAQTQDDPDERAAEINSSLQLARSQTATLFELRTALDDFELRGEVAADAVAAAANRIPANSAWPEMARARAVAGALRDV